MHELEPMVKIEIPNYSPHMLTAQNLVEVEEPNPSIVHGCGNLFRPAEMNASGTSDPPLSTIVHPHHIIIHHSQIIEESWKSRYKFWLLCVHLDGKN